MSYGDDGDEDCANGADEESADEESADDASVSTSPKTRDD